MSFRRLGESGLTGGSVTLDRVKRGRLCTGCGACAALVDKIRIEPSSDGFNRPVPKALLNWQEDQRIAKVCPGLRLQCDGEDRSDPLWGRVVSLRTGHARGPALRFRSASGGALSAILVYLVEHGLVDFIVHTAADPANPMANRTVASSSRDEIANAAGSRYAPSSPLAELERYLARGKRFAFVGKPCDVSALRQMARQDCRINAQIPYMLSFFCAGVPSRKGAEEVLRDMAVDPAEVTRFRYRGNGWPGATTARLSDGTEREMSYRASWGGILSKHVQFRCKICPDGTGRDADIVCADAWHGDAKGYPNFEEAEGRSLILCRTPKGEAILQEALSSGLLDASDESLEILPSMQPGQATRMRVLIARLVALIVTLQPAPIYRGFSLWKAARHAGLWALLQNFLGTGRRVLAGRR